jgi:NAD-dependent deacetylase
VEHGVSVPAIPASLAAALARAQRVAVLTGAGISAESGIPTFREAQTGLWKRYRPEDLATPEAFRRNPRLVWEWYEWRRGIVDRAQPNAGHHALAQMERRVADFTLITQNVDGLHCAAGSSNVLELHGNIRRSKCFDRGHEVAHWPATGDVPPRCPECGSLLRPDVVWFGESLPAEALEGAFAAAQHCELFLSVGTSTVVAPASSLPFAALEAGATVVEINPTATPLTSRAHFALTGAAGEVLPALAAAAWPTTA